MSPSRNLRRLIELLCLRGAHIFQLSKLFDFFCIEISRSVYVIICYHICTRITAASASNTLQGSVIFSDLFRKTDFDGQCSE